MDNQTIENKIICGDCLEVMKSTLPDKCIDLTITSPPYDNLRDYKGFIFDFEGIANELYRVTKDGGVVVWVVGDATVNGSETGTSFKQALYFKEIGFRLHDTMIYAKNNPVPLTHNRYEQQFEYMFILSKGKPKTFNPIMIKCKTAGTTYTIVERNKFSNEPLTSIRDRNRNRNEIITTSSKKRDYNIWYTNCSDTQYNHPAIFPEELVHRHIKSWSNEDDLIFDPMSGSGTTCQMAKMSGRKYLGIEISEEYVDIINERMSNISPDITKFINEDEDESVDITSFSCNK